MKRSTSSTSSAYIEMERTISRYLRQVKLQAGFNSWCAYVEVPCLAMRIEYSKGLHVFTKGTTAAALAAADRWRCMLPSVVEHLCEIDKGCSGLGDG